MDSLHKIRMLAGIPVDLSKPANAANTVRIPAKLTEAAKVPQHRGELAPKTKDNMRARVNHAKKALEALELARQELMDLPAVDYMEDIPTIIKQLHNMLHGDDGTGGLHFLHRSYKQDFDNTVFPEDIEQEKEKQEQEEADAAAGVTDEDKKAPAKKKTNESAEEPAAKSDGLGFEKQKNDPASENKKPFKLAPESTPLNKTMYANTDDQKAVEEDPNDNVERDGKVVENIDPAVKKAVQDADVAKNNLLKSPFGGKPKKEAPVDIPTLAPKTAEQEEEHICPKNPVSGEHVLAPADAQCVHCDADMSHVDTREKGTFGGRIGPSQKEPTMEAKKPKWLEKAEVKAEEKKGEKVSKKEKKKVEEGQGPLFARDAQHPNHDAAVSVQYPSWGEEGKPANVVSSEDGVSLYYPNGQARTSPSQPAMNPYNEAQKVKVPPAIKTALKEEADMARKLAETFTIRKDWDNKNFHENLANAFDALAAFLDKETIYGIKEAQIFMTSLMSPMMYKIPAEVVKFVAAGGTQRSLKSYMNDVKEPVTGKVFSQDSNGLK